MTNDKAEFIEACFQLLFLATAYVCMVKHLIK
jgi:hypothetical protein